MKKTFLLIPALLIAICTLIIAPINAQASCPYVATKFRAKIVGATNPWRESLTVNRNNNPQIQIVVFQCTAAQTANCDNVARNANVRLSGAGITATYDINDPGDTPTIVLTQPGTITATVTTPGSSGAGCTDTDTITVTGAAAPTTTGGTTTGNTTGTTTGSTNTTGTTTGTTPLPNTSEGTNVGALIALASFFIILGVNLKKKY